MIEMAGDGKRISLITWDVGYQFDWPHGTRDGHGVKHLFSPCVPIDLTSMPFALHSPLFSWQVFALTRISRSVRPGETGRVWEGIVVSGVPMFVDFSYHIGDKRGFK